LLPFRPYYTDRRRSGSRWLSRRFPGMQDKQESCR
jgi:hypothetical protein